MRRLSFKLDFNVFFLSLLRFPNGFSNSGEYDYFPRKKSRMPRSHSDSFKVRAPTAAFNRETHSLRRTRVNGNRCQDREPQPQRSSSKVIIEILTAWARQSNLEFPYVRTVTVLAVETGNCVRILGARPAHKGHFEKVEKNRFKTTTLSRATTCVPRSLE